VKKSLTCKKKKKADVWNGFMSSFAGPYKKKTGRTEKFNNPGGRDA